MNGHDTKQIGMKQAPSSEKWSISAERLRIIVQDSHVNFLVGAGTPAAYFGLLGSVEDALTQISTAMATEDQRTVVRASIQAYFYDRVIAPNLAVLGRTPPTSAVLESYTSFLSAINRILLKRHSSILAKQVNLFTTNVDMLFEVALEQMRIDFSDGFVGKINPSFDPGDFDNLRFRMSSRFEHRSEVPVFNLIKLHGSVGWLQENENPDQFEIHYDHGLSVVTSVGAAREAARNSLIWIENPDEVNAAKLVMRVQDGKVPDSVYAFLDAYSRLGIVNPDKQKFATTVLNATYYELIRRFANALERENSVLFVHGFSFRDEHLREVVVRGARTNPTLQVVVFCYSAADFVDYQELIPLTDIRNGNILFVRPLVEQEDELKATIDVVTQRYFEPVVADRFADADKPVERDLRGLDPEETSA